MDTFFEFPIERRRILCEESYERLGLVPSSIEKDIWVCWVLRELFSLPKWQGQLTFKGGTSLSKGWQLISRFSEDIDVVIDRAFLGFSEESLSRSRRDKLRDACRQNVQEELLPALIQRVSTSLPDGLTWKLYPVDKTEDPEQLTLLFQYPTAFAGSSTYLQPIVKIELGGRADTEPVEMPVIKPYLSDAFPDIFPKSTFAVRTVAARRTFWEKAMLLHEEKFRPADKGRKARLSRHYYDLWCMIEKGIARQALDDQGLFDRVAQHRQVFYRQTWVDYSTLRIGSLDLIPTAAQLHDWQQDYEAMRGVMFFEEPPTFDEILRRIQQFQEEFNHRAVDI
ncbi:MAG: nucleotidyl transferase AbiEii/AbiGii toxin family protein [bacterium]